MDAPITPIVPRYVGFTPFAKANLLTADGFVKETSIRRTFVFGYRTEKGDRIRHEHVTTLRVAFVMYAASDDYTRMWVKWEDGKRRLVHRKA